MSKARFRVYNLSSHRRETARNAKYSAKPPSSKRKKVMKTVAELQADFCAAFIYNTPSTDQMKPTGEIDGDFMWVYKLQPDQPWCFKSAVPITADTALAVATYLAGLQGIAPDFANRPDVEEAA